MSVGARTLYEVVKMTGVCTSCEGCKNELNNILSSVCGCKEVSLKEVVDTFKNGPDTLDKVGEVTEARIGEDC